MHLYSKIKVVILFFKELCLFTVNIDRRLSLLKGETSVNICRGSARVSVTSVGGALLRQRGS